LPTHFIGTWPSIDRIRNHKCELCLSQTLKGSADSERTEQIRHIIRIRYSMEEFRWLDQDDAHSFHSVCCGHHWAQKTILTTHRFSALRRSVSTIAVMGKRYPHQIRIHRHSKPSLLQTQNRENERPWQLSSACQLPTRKPKHILPPASPRPKRAHLSGE